MRLRALVCPLGLLLLSSCAYLDPYVLPTPGDVCTENSNHARCKELPKVASVMADLKQWRADTEKKLCWSVSTSRGLDVATFGFVTAFAVRGVHEAAIGAGAKNVALAAGTSYTASKLFAPATAEDLYLSAQNALSCVIDRGNGVVGVYVRAVPLRKEMSEKLGAVRLCDKELGKELVAEFEKAYTTAAAVQSTIEATDPDIGSTLRDTGSNILSALNIQLKAQRPNPEAILNAGAGVSLIAGGMMPSTTTPPPPPTKALTEAACPKPEDVLSPILAAKSLEAAWKTSYNAIGALKDGCAMAPVSVAPLTVAQNAVTLVPGTTFNLVYSGGRPPIHAQWVKDIPKGDQLALTPLPGSSMFQITRPPSDKSSTTFTLRVFDSAAIPSSTEVSVAVPAPAPAK